MTDSPAPKKKRIVHSSQRSFDWMKRHGYPLVGKVERWVPNPMYPGGGIRMDLFGWADILALAPDGRWVMIQSCGATGRMDHIRKLSDPRLTERIGMWLNSPAHAAELWTWRKLRMKGTKAREKWELKRDVLMVRGGKLAYIQEGGLFGEAPEPVRDGQVPPLAEGLSLIDELREEMK